MTVKNELVSIVCNKLTKCRHNERMKEVVTDRSELGDAKGERSLQKGVVG